MRILVATPLYPPEPGGPATYTKLLESELPKRGVEVSVAKFSDVRRYPRVLRHIAYFFLVWHMAARADIIFAQDVFSAGAPAMLAAFARGKTFMVRVPGDYAWEQGIQRFGVKDSIDDFQKKRYGIAVGFFRFAQRTVVCSARLVIVPSDYFNSIVRGWGVPASRVRTIYNGIDLEVSATLPSSTPQKPIAVSVGRLVPWKGFAFLISLLPQLPAWTLVIVGDGPQRGMLEALAKEKGVAERVRFTGALPRAELFGWLRAADAFALDTSFESFSFQVVEAMAAGVPVITTKIGSLPELIEDGADGRLLEPDDAAGFVAALTGVEREPAAWKARVAHAKEKASRFSISATVDRLMEEIQRLHT